MVKNGTEGLAKSQSDSSSHRTIETVVVDKEVHITNLHLVFFDWPMSLEETDRELNNMGFRRAKSCEIPKNVNFDQYFGGRNWPVCFRVVVIKR